jgi:hypothetical protein
MELAALALAEALKKPAVPVHHYWGGKALVLTTSTEEAWARRIMIKNKSVNLPYDPLVAPLAFLASVKKVMPYMRAGNS